MTTFIYRKSVGHKSVSLIISKSDGEFRGVPNHKEIPRDDVYIRWGCTSNVPRDNTTFIINSADAIHKVNNKAQFRKAIPVDVRVPTYIFLENEIPEEAFPGIVRKQVHSRGKEAVVINNKVELDRFLDNNQEYMNGYISPIINKVREYRVYVGSGRVLALANKIPEDPNALMWNHAEGASFANVRWGDWDLNVCHAALKAFKPSGLHFGGVDVIVDNNGFAYVLEINSAPSITSDYRAAIFYKYFKYVIDHRHYIAHQAGNSWRAFIHPAIGE